jgi:hypothetical protein
VLIVIVGMVMFWNRSSDNAPSVRTGPAQTQRAVGEGSDNPQPTSVVRPIVVQTGKVPDVRGQTALVGIHAISEAGLRFFVIEVKNSKVPQETIYQQSPSPGTKVDEGSVVTLMVSR